MKPDRTSLFGFNFTTIICEIRSKKSQLQKLQQSKIIGFCIIRLAALYTRAGKYVMPKEVRFWSHDFDTCVFA